MLENFFVTSPDDLHFLYSTSYNVPLIVLSVFIAMFAAFCAFEMIERLARSTPRRFWLPTGSLILGVGVWAMHFLGMLALKVDCSITYDAWKTGLSMLPSILSAAYALNIVAEKNVPFFKTCLAGIVLAFGVALMHFLGMSAIELDGVLRYNTKLFLLAIFVATTLVVIALLVKWALAKRPKIKTPFVSSAMMGSLLGLSISFMHYIAVEATYFLHLHPDGNEHFVVATNPQLLAMAVTIITILLILCGLVFMFLSVKIGNMGNRLNAILATTSQGFIVINNDGIIIECNHAMADLVGMSQAQLIGKNCHNIVGLQNCNALRGNQKTETLLHHATGEAIPCLVHQNVVTDDEGEALYSFALFSDISERLEAENKLQIRERRFYALLESMPDPMIVVDENGLIKMVNRQAEAFFGYTKDALFNQPVEILIPVRFREKHVSLRQQFMQNAKIRPMGVGLELSALTCDGREVLIELSLGFIETATQPMVAATLRDISERKRLEAENRRNEIRLFDILNISPIAVRIAIKRTGQIIFYNRSYAELIGNFDAIGDTPQGYYANSQDYQDVLSELEKGESVLNRQIELKVPNRGKTWVLGSYATIEYQDEDAILGWFYDITERIETQQKLSQQIELQKQTTQELNAIFEAASSGIVRLQNRKIVRCNHKAEEIFGYEAGELEGKNTRIWYPDEAAYQRVGERSQQAVMCGNIYQDELQYVKKDGNLFWCAVKAQLLDINDRGKGIVVVLNDVTERHQATQALFEAKEIAESATKMKSDFLANMSHEIRTPMNAIIGLSHLVMKTEMSDKQREYLKKIQLSSQHLLGVINDILDFSKIEAGKLTIEKIEFGLESVLNNISQLVHDKAIEKGLELIFDIAPDVPNNLIGDPLRIGQVLINLGTNAIKFTQQGEINVVIRKLEETDETVFIRFAVIDTGIGLSDEQISKLFESFQQADTSTTRKYGGTGLGLAICKSLVEMMGGQVGLNSKLDEGSEFWFTLQLGKSTPRALLPHPDLRGKRVLVVDDNENARTVIAHLLQSMSFEIDEVDSGKAALEIVQTVHENAPYDAIFLDWQMPNMDGIEVARQLKNRGLSSNTKLFLVTAYGREEVLKNAPTVGFDEVLFKPVTASILFDSMARAFGQMPRQELTVSDYVTAHDLSSIVGAQILVVEDNQINQEIAQELLESEGFEVEIAENGQIALEKVQQKNYDLVLMDMQMPVMDGVSATLEMRKLPQFNNLPIIAMTANAMMQDKENCFAAGMNDHIAKPIEPEDLWAKLLKWIKPRHAARSQTTANQVANEQIAIPTEIAGLDSELGLRRVLNKREFYVSILKSFANTQANALLQIEIALQKNDFDSAYRLAHTLKGLLGNIGATALQAQATEIETLIKNHDALENIAPKLKTVEPILRALIVQLRDYLQLDNPENLQVQTLDVEALKTVATKLAALFADSDSDAIDYFAEHSGLLKTAFPEQFKSLQTKIDNYDFPDALELLKQAALTQQIEI